MFTLSTIDCPVNIDDLQACHRLYSKKCEKNTIIKFVNRKNAEKAITKRKKIMDVDTTTFGDNFTGDEKIYISQNLTPFYASLAWKVRTLKRKGLITGFKVFGASIKISSGESTFFTRIRNDDDLKCYFPPDTDLSFFILNKLRIIFT